MQSLDSRGKIATDLFASSNPKYTNLDKYTNNSAAHLCICVDLYIREHYIYAGQNKHPRGAAAQFKEFRRGFAKE